MAPDPQLNRGGDTHAAVGTVLSCLGCGVQLAKRLFDVEIEAADGQVAVWDDAVRFFCVKQGGKPKAYFYLDPYSRPAEKRGGAWMDEVASQSKLVRSSSSSSCL